MYELNRARLVGIGPRGARYDDVTLDLSALGDRIPARTLLDADTRRPSPYTLLLLENGGGKSVLLKLLFSVVLPGRRKTVGGASLDKFVLDGDTGHVALEWMHVGTGERLVTAKAYQRRARTASNNNPLAEAWYSFRPSDTIDLHTLPVEVEGRRRRLEGYKDAVEAAGSAAPQTELAWVGDDQGRWRTHLRERGIEPDLFDIQRSMNVDEGEAANAFKFTSSKAFVDWLLTTVTDPGDAASVADTFEQWATNLAQREQMLLERDFLEGAIAGLEPLADTHAAEQEAQQRARAARHHATTLARSLSARRDLEQALARQLEEEEQVARGAVTRGETERDNARELLNEVTLQTLRLDLAAAQAAQSATTRQREAVELEIAGWALASELDQRDQAQADASQLAAQVAAADADAAPALERRDQAAGRLLAKLDAEADAADAQADRHDALHDAARLAAAAANTDRTAAVSAAAATTERHRAATEQAAQADRRLTEAARSGVVPAGTRPADMDDVVAQARGEHEAASERLVRARAALLGADEQVAARREAQATAREARTGTQRTADTARRDADSSMTAARRLADLPLLDAAAGQDGEPMTALGLDEAADRLLGALEVSINQHTEQQDALREQQREDARVMQALGDGGLLPPRAEVEAAIDVLAAKGITAHSGWKYLHDSASEQHRAALIEAHPELADGLVVIDGSQLGPAQAVLTQAQLLPSAAVAVGDGAALLTLPADTSSSKSFVVPPTPAMYDEVVAAGRREELAAVMQARATSLAEATEQLGAVRSVYTELSMYRRNNPPGHLQSLLNEAAARSDADQAALEVLRVASEALDAAESAQREAREALGDASDYERARADAVSVLVNLAEQVESGRAVRDSLDALAADVARLEAEAVRHEQLRAAAEVAQSEHARDSAQARSRAERFRAWTADVVSTSGARAAEAPEEGLPALRATAEAAQRAWLAMATDPDLMRRAEDAAERVRQLDAALSQRDPSHLAEARRLRGTPAGADRTGWAVAVRTARTERDKLVVQADAATLRVGNLEQAVAAAAPTEPGRRNWMVLAPQWRPTSGAHGQELQVLARAELDAAQAALDRLSGHATRLGVRRLQAHDAYRSFREAVGPVRVVVDETAHDASTTVDPFQGTVEAASAAANEAVEAVQSTRSAAESARAELADAVNELVAFANQNRFDAMVNLVRRSILEAPRDTLGARAGEWASQLQARLATLTTDLETANRYRNQIVSRLTALVDQALRTLRQASRLSELPGDLADWGGRKFLRIAFAETDSASIAVRVADVVDRVATQFATRSTGSRGTSPRRDGMALLLDAVHASVPKGFTVDVLKPDSVLRDERVSIEEMSDVFSGGQELTAAIILYCTLAALRANERGQMRAKHAGVLFLDNPIGRASASYLLDLQQSVARALGVQLIYTTGLSDDRVLASFPLWVRMRNDADLRAGLKHIQVAEVVRNALPEPFDHDAEALTAPGTVTATRVYRRPGVGGTPDPALVP